MSDDPARALAASAAVAEPAGGEAPSGSRPWVQITETTGSPADARELLETADAYGRVPVVVRIRRVPPIRMELVAVAVVLVATGVLAPLDVVFRGLVIIAALLALVSGLASRLFLRIPAGSVGLVAEGGRYRRTYRDGSHRVRPNVMLTHVVTTRELGFDVPVSEVRSLDGVGVTVDLLLTLGITDHAKMVYNITTGDLDQLIHATAQDAVRSMVRGIEALDALDLGDAAAERIRATIDGRLATYGLAVRGVTFTRVTLPESLTRSLEARRLAAVQLDEEQETHTLQQRRLTDRAALVVQEQEARRRAVELEGAAEGLRLQLLDDRLTRYPRAAQYDLETGRLRVAQQLAGNSRAVVSLGGGDLVSSLLAVRESGADAPG